MFGPNFFDKYPPRYGGLKTEKHSFSFFTLVIISMAKTHKILDEQKDSGIYFFTNPIVDGGGVADLCFPG